MNASLADPALRAVLGRVCVAVSVLALWEAAAGPLRLAHGLVPAPSAIAGRMVSDGFAFYAAAAWPTLLGAGSGWLVGNAAGIALAALTAAAPRLGRPLGTLALAGFCIPGIALGPILAVLGPAEMSRIALAALPIAFLTLEALDLQAATVPAGLGDAVRAFGGGRRAVLTCLALPGSMPGLFTALRVSVPFALLGAVSADFLGAERGLGIVLVTAQHRFMVDRAWAVALLLGGVAALSSAGLRWAGRRVAPWSAAVPVDPAPARVGTRRPALRAAASTTLHLLMRAAVVVGAWWAVPHLFGWPPLIAKGPFDVLSYLADPANGGARRSTLVGEILVTAGDCLSGLVCGVALALACAVATTAMRALRGVVIGPALVAQCLPIAAFTPLVVLAVGRGAAVAPAIGTLVVFVPVVLGVWGAFSRVPRALRDLATVHAASRTRLVLIVMVPAATPACLASIRTAVPLACAGALLAEWLATGRGAGYGMLVAAATFDYSAVWARIAAVTGLTLLVYGLVRATEIRLLARWAGADFPGSGSRAGGLP